MESSQKKDVIVKRPIKSNFDHILQDMRSEFLGLTRSEVIIMENLLKQAYNSGVGDAIETINKTCNVIYTPSMDRLKNLMKDRS